MGRMIIWEYWGLSKDGHKFSERVQTKSSRRAKVAKMIEQHLANKYGLTYLHLEEFGFQEVKEP